MVEAFARKGALFARAQYVSASLLLGLLCMTAYVLAEADCCLLASIPCS
jgi:hypothetical protein